MARVGRLLCSTIQTNGFVGGDKKCILPVIVDERGGHGGTQKIKLKPKLHSHTHKIFCLSLVIYIYKAVMCLVLVYI